MSSRRCFCCHHAMTEHSFFFLSNSALGHLYTYFLTERSGEVFYETWPKHCMKKKSSKVAADPEFDSSTSGNEAGHRGGRLETRAPEEFRHLTVNEADNKLLNVSALLLVHVMGRPAKVKCFERGQKHAMSNLPESKVNCKKSGCFEWE